MTLRIAYITDEELPNKDASAIQIVHTLSALARAGAQVDMIFPVRPALVDAQDRLRQGLIDHFHAECGFGLLPLPTRQGSRLAVKTLHGLLATQTVLRGAWDVIYTRNLIPILPLLAAGRDLVFETYRPLTRQYPAARPALNAVARSSHFLGLITHSQFARNAFVAHGLPAEKVRTVYNGFDPQAFAVKRTPSEARKRLGWAERPTVVYTGRLAPVKNTGLLLDAAAATPQAQWVLVGTHDTDEARPYADRARAMGHVALPGYLTGEALTLALQAADVLVIPPSADPLEVHGTTVLPIKMFTYLAAGRAIVAGDLADARELLIEGETARLVLPDSVEALATAISALVADESLREHLAAGARRRCLDLTWDARARHILEFLEERRQAARRA